MTSTTLRSNTPTKITFSASNPLSKAKQSSSSIVPTPVFSSTAPPTRAQSGLKMMDSNIVIIKIGSNSLVRPDGSVNQEYLNDVANQCATLMNKYKVKIALVSSGACATGVHDMGLKEKPDAAEEKMALSAIGQVSIIHNWEEAFFHYNIRCAQFLLTQRAFTDYTSSTNFFSTIAVLFKWNIVPIINENDPIAIKAITVGDNDRLASLLSTQLNAHTLVLLTDIDGLYDKDPRYNKDAKKLDQIESVTTEMLDAAGGPGAKGRGGMRSKLESARFAAMGGAQVVIARASEPSVIERSVIKQDNMGTRIMPARIGAEFGVTREQQLLTRWRKCTDFLQQSKM